MSNNQILLMTNEYATICDGVMRVKVALELAGFVVVEIDGRSAHVTLNNKGEMVEYNPTNTIYGHSLFDIRNNDDPIAVRNLKHQNSMNNIHKRTQRKHQLRNRY